LTMAPLTSFVLAALIASVYAVPATNPALTTIPFAKRIQEENLVGLLQRDQARARALIKAAKQARLGKRASAGSIPATNEAVTYVASVGVGTPPTQFDLIVDTGSSNTWVGAGTAFKSTSSTVQTGASVSVTYGSGSFSGNEVLDTVTLSSSLVIKGQSLGVATTSTGFGGVDGIIGIGPEILTEGTLSTGEDVVIPTVTQNLFSQGLIPETLVAVSFNPTTSDVVTNGELTFGGTDSSKFTGSITFTPVTTVEEASFFWGIQQTINLAGTSILTTNEGIVDTGTTLVLLGSTAFSKYQSATKATLDRTTGLLKITSANFAKLGSLNFVIGGVTFPLTANAQLWPRSLNTAIGGVAGTNYLIVNSLGENENGFDFVNGQTFLERFYSVFDTTNNRVGFATTANTDATSN